MIEQEPNTNELAFISELEKYVDKWVAIMNYGTDRETIVASGESILEARSEAESKGFKEITFLKVPPTDKVFVPLT